MGNRRKVRLNLRIDAQLKEWVKKYAEARGTDVTKLICDYLQALRSMEQEAGDVEQI
jgi:uncharacterized protein (DUF1778 family)